MKILVVIDMQNDFIRGALSREESAKTIPHVVDRVKKATLNNEMIIFTRDTHEKNYLETREGRALPVEHCIRDTWGWNIIDELLPYTNEKNVVDKITFGSSDLAEMLAEENARENIDQITLVGVCTDICVISNAMVLRAFLPEAEIVVEEGGCAGVNREKHDIAVKAMSGCQMVISP